MLTFGFRGKLLVLSLVTRNSEYPKRYPKRLLDSNREQPNFTAPSPWRVQSKCLTRSDLLFFFHKQVTNFLVGRALVDRRTGLTNFSPFSGGFGFVFRFGRGIAGISLRCDSFPACSISVSSGLDLF